jgi:type IV pilus assembly protein PilE
MKKSGIQGFTLIEVIVVAVIIAVLSAVAIPLYDGYLRDARIDAAKNNCQLIGAAVMQVHNRGVDIPSNGWAALGMSSLSDNLWTYTFGGSSDPYLGSSSMDTTYTVTATGAGPMLGVNGGFKPYAAANARWTGGLQ